jgi:hypothetical protein
VKLRADFGWTDYYTLDEVSEVLLVVGLNVISSTRTIVLSVISSTRTIVLSDISSIRAVGLSDISSIRSVSIPQIPFCYEHERDRRIDEEVGAQNDRE